MGKSKKSKSKAAPVEGDEDEEGADDGEERKGSKKKKRSKGKKDKKKDNSKPKPSSKKVAPTNQHELVMEQALADFYDKPEADQAPPQEKRYPFYTLRKLMGWAHVNLVEAIIDGSQETVKATILRLQAAKKMHVVNDPDEHGRTPLALAIKAQREDLANILLSLESTDVNIREKTTGLSPLHFAAQLDFPATVQRIVFKGGEVDAQDKVGMTPLMLACRMGHRMIVEILVDDFMADTELRDVGGWSCLFYAVYHNELEVVQSLYGKGVRRDVKDKQGMLAVDWADAMGYGPLSYFMEDSKKEGSLV